MRSHGELESHADELGRLDAEAGDGDLGVTATNAAAAILDVLSSFDGNDLADLLSECGTAVSRKAPSTAGTLLATGLLERLEVRDARPHSELRCSRNFSTPHGRQSLLGVRQNLETRR